jgi:uncharacterized delta-60 repeat protein
MFVTNRRARACLALVALCAPVAAITARVLEGSPDPTFGGGGLVLQDFARTDDFVDDIALQGDGKIVVLGGGRLARFFRDGQLDPTFRDAGQVLTTPKLDVRRVAIQPDSKLVVAGTTRAGATTSACAVARLNGDGSFDRTFANDGVAFLDFVELCTGAADLAVDANGHIVVVLGLVQVTLPRRFSVATVRLRADGFPDTSFDNDGFAFESFADLRFPSSLAIEPGGKLVVGAEHIRGYALFRYNADGTRDESLDGTGLLVDQVVTDDIAASQRPEGIVVDEHGTLTVALSGVFLPRFTVTRHLVDGSRVTSFGSNGTALGPLGSTGAIAGQPDGRVVVAGVLKEKTGGLGIARFNVDGSPDTTFASEGVTTVTVTNGRIDPGPTPLVLQPDGRIVAATAANLTSSSPPHDWLLIRLLGRAAGGTAASERR